MKTLMSKREFSRGKIFFSTSRLSIDIATVLEKVNDFHYQGKVVDGWSVGTVPNGGYLMMLAIKAAKNSSIEHPDPLSVTAYYASRGFENVPADIHIRMISKNRSTTTLHLTMSQENELKSEYLAVFGNLDKFNGFSMNHKPSLSLPAREDCIDCTPILQKIESHVSYFNKINVLLPKNDPFLSGYFIGKRGEKAYLNCWTKFTDQRSLCLPSLAFFLDALTPPIINLRPSKWVPTMQYTVHFWSKPPVTGEEDDYWIQQRLETLYSKNGILHIDSEAWSADGKHLLATSRQMARLMEAR